MVRAIASELQEASTFKVLRGADDIEFRAGIGELGQPDLFAGRSDAIEGLHRSADFAAITNSIAVPIFLEGIAEAGTVVVAGLYLAAGAGFQIALFGNPVIVQIG